MEAFALGECFVIGPVSFGQAGQSVVSFVTTRLEIDPVCLVTLPLELLDCGPGSRPCGRILHRLNDLEGVDACSSPPFDEVQILAGPLKISLGSEVRHVNNE